MSLGFGGGGGGGGGAGGGGCWAGWAFSRFSGLELKGRGGQGKEMPRKAEPSRNQARKAELEMEKQCVQSLLPTHRILEPQTKQPTQAKSQNRAQGSKDTQLVFLKHAPWHFPHVLQQSPPPWPLPQQQSGEG